MSVWSDGSNDVNRSNYLVYYKGELLFPSGCPPSLHDTFEYKQLEECNHNLEHITQQVLTELC